MNRFTLCCAIVASAALFAVARDAQAGEPLHRRIDMLLADKAETALDPVAGDAEFLRRVYLDLAGRIPSATEARSFLQNREAQKRETLIEALLAGDDYPRRMQEAFNVMLMERRPLHPELKERVGHDVHWNRFLRESFAANKPWDQLVREILHPDPQDEVRRGAAFFYTRRLEKWGQVPADFPGVVRDVGRLFLGVDLQCAECHDHLFIADYSQRDYQGLATFFLPVSIRSDTNFPAISEKPLASKTEFTSVLTKAASTIGPRLPFGQEMEIPAFGKGEEYAQPPDKKTGFPGVPKFSTLAALATQLASAENPAFARNIANRMWFLMLGRGLVEPLDLSHAGNPPLHPELLQLLADELAAHKFDLKWFMRELALSRAYQATGLLPATGSNLSDAKNLAYREKPLSPEQLLWSVLQATEEIDGIRAPAAATTAPMEFGVKAGAATRAPSLDELHARFAAAFGNPPKVAETSLKPSVKSALFLMNDDLIQTWLQPRAGNLIDRLSKPANPGAVADELYVSILSRSPTEEEQAEVAALLADVHDQPRRGVLLGNLAWALLASPEFCTNH